MYSTVLIFSLREESVFKLFQNNCLFQRANDRQILAIKTKPIDFKTMSVSINGFQAPVRLCPVSMYESIPGL